MLSYISRCTFFLKQCYRTSADIRKLGYFITLVRGCPGSQLSRGFEINEDILRYASGGPDLRFQMGSGDTMIEQSLASRRGEASRRECVYGV